MSLQEIYKTFLRNPTAAGLSQQAALHYVTTLTSLHTAAAIVKHNAAHSRVLKKKEEKIVSCVEGPDSICVDVETTIEFISSGGAYLPGLDDNFVSDRTVTFPMIHIVHFNHEQKIHHIRLYWDQGAMLKQMDVIGARARNWPIRDGKDQAKLIATCTSANDSGDSRPSTAASNLSGRETGFGGKSRSQSSNVTRDPHASLDLFAPRNDEDPDNGPAAIAPRASAKPPPRDYGDLFVGNSSDASPQDKRRPALSPKRENSVIAPKASTAKPAPRDYHDLFVGNESDSSPQAKRGATSPRKELMSPPIAPKSGAGKNYRPSRLFDMEGDDPATPRSPVKGNQTKGNSTKYSHFEFGDGDDAPALRNDRPMGKHQSQWGFEDFVTPQKPHIKPRPGDQDKRHFGFGDEEDIMDSPAKHPNMVKARPDANVNFEFQDDGTPQGNRRPAGSALGGTNVRSAGLYENNLPVENDQVVSKQDKTSQPLSTVTNLKDRRKDFDPHFSMTDDSPSQAELTKPSVPENRAKVVSQMGSQWEASDESPVASSTTKGNSRLLANNKENMGPVKNVGIKSGGDGMGGKKGTGRSWGFGDESDEDGEGGKNAGKFQAAKKQHAQQDSGIWDF